MRFIVAAAFVANTVNAWWESPHLVIARIAYDILDYEREVEKIREVDELLFVLKRSDPRLTRFEGEHPFVECATFGHELSHMPNGSFQDDWHWIAIPYLDEGGKIDDFNFTEPAHNITQAIWELANFIEMREGYKDMYAYKALTAWNPDGKLREEDHRSIAMRLLINLIADAHQPLRTADRVDKEHETGDKGGIDFPIPKREERDPVDNLHEVWDSDIYRYEHFPHLPLDTPAWNICGDEAYRMIRDYPIADKKIAEDIDLRHWIEESYKLGAEFAYKDAKENVTLSDGYLHEAREKAEFQMVLAGNRLANVIKALRIRPRPPTLYERFMTHLNKWALKAYTAKGFL